MDEDDLKERWNELLQWLNRQLTDIQAFKAKMVVSAERGRSLVAVEDIKGATAILSLPQSVLLSTKSIPEEFINSHSSGLTSVQALTLFIANFRSVQRTCDDPRRFLSENPFSSYLSTLPDNFSDLPLVWILQATFRDLECIYGSDNRSLDRLEELIKPSNNRCSVKYYQLMSSTTIKCSNDVLRRFYEDWLSLQADLVNIFPQILLSELLWAWLVVNTRCIWYNLGHKNPADNIALAPAFDMANHSPISTVTPVITPHTLTMYSSYPRGTFTSPRTHQVLSSSKPSNSSMNEQVCIKKGDEITFSYGPHGNSTLLTEYGFIVMDFNPWDSIDITDEIESLFHLLDEVERTRKISILKETNYWSDYTIQCNTTEISHRTLVALRLLHTPSGQIAEWQDHVEGKTDELGADTELEVQHSLKKIFVELGRKTENLFNFIIKAEDHRFGLSAYSFRCLKVLASNELNVISQLKK